MAAPASRNPSPLNASMAMPTVLKGSARCWDVTMISCSAVESLDDDAPYSAARAAGPTDSKDMEAMSFRTKNVCVLDSLFICGIPLGGVSGRVLVSSVELTSQLHILR